MSVYHHVANKDEILDGIVDIVFGEIELPSTDGDWRAEIASSCDLGPPRAAAGTPGRSRCWSRAPAPARRRCATTTRSSATLRAAGFSVEMTAHAYALLDAYVYGFAIQEAALPFEGPDTVAEVAEPMMAAVHPRVRTRTWSS